MVITALFGGSRAHITALQSGISIIPGLRPDAKFKLLTQMDSRLVGQRERN